MVRSMLYAADLGLYAPFALQHALSLARSFRAKLYVVHAVEPLGLLAESVLSSYLDDTELNHFRAGGVEQLLKVIEQRVLDGFCERLGASPEDMALIAAIRVLSGDPAQVILDQSRRLGADLVVIGSHSQPSAPAVALGRTADRVLQCSSVPVYLVPVTHARQPAGS